MDALIRFARSEDYTGVARLVTQIHQIHVAARPDIYAPYDNPLGRAYFTKMLNEERTAVMVAAERESGEIQGYAVLRVQEAATRPIFQPRKYILIDDLCVEEKLRGRGIGRALFRFAEGYAREIAAASIELAVDAFNADAVRFYESLGMSTRSKRMEKKLTKGL